MAKEALFNILEHKNIISGATILDLFCGTGSISLEFISRGAEKVVSVDSNPQSKTLIYSVSKEWELDNIFPLRADVFRYVKEHSGAYNIIFADPPYNNPKLDQLPEMVLSSNLLHPDGIFILEHGKEKDFSKTKGFVEIRRYGSVCFSFFEKEK